MSLHSFFQLSYPLQVYMHFICNLEERLIQLEPQFNILLGLCSCLATTSPRGLFIASAISGSISFTDRRSMSLSKSVQGLFPVIPLSPGKGEVSLPSFSTSNPQTSYHFMSVEYNYIQNASRTLTYSTSSTLSDSSSEKSANSASATPTEPTIADSGPSPRHLRIRAMSSGMSLTL